MICLEKFMEWLDNEEKEIEAEIGEQKFFMKGRYSEVIKIKSKLCEMDAHDKEIEDELGVICQRYCKFPEAYGDREDDNQRMIEERCNNCPLNRLVK